MQIQLNGKNQDVAEGCTLLCLLKNLKLDAARVVVEVNSQIIKPDLFATTRLQENDKLELLHFVGGG